MNFPIYLDNHATTRMDGRVLDAMLPYLKESYGNPSSGGHSFGWTANEAVQNARNQVSQAINAMPDEITFTSGTTEANNLIIKGLFEAYGSKKDHLITGSTEHPSVLEAMGYLRHKGANVTVLPSDQYGLIDIEELKSSITDRTLLVSIMTANNEIGTISPVKEIAEVCHEMGTLFHTDAAQATGKIRFDVKDLGADLVSFNSHKNYGPKGVGALYMKKRSPALKLIPLLHGGGQERAFRSGTLNVPAIVGFGKAMELSSVGLRDEYTAIQMMRDYLQNMIFAKLDGIQVNGHPEKRLPNNLNISIEGVNVDMLLLELKNLAVSTGSACASSSHEPSHVLKAIGLKGELLSCTLRFGLGRFNTQQEIEYAAESLIKAVNKIRVFNRV